MAVQKNPFRRLLRYVNEELVRNVSLAKYNVFIVGIMGSSGHPIYWFLWTYIDPQPYENPWLRGIGAFSCLLLLLNRYWPRSLKPYLPHYYFLTTIYSTVFFFTVYFIRSEFSMTWSAAEIAMIFFITMTMPRYSMMIMSSLLGILLAIAYCAATGGMPAVDVGEWLIDYVPLFVFSGLACVLISKSNLRGLLAQEKYALLKALEGAIPRNVEMPFTKVKTALEELADKEMNLSAKHSEKSALEVLTLRLEQANEELQTAQKELVKSEKVKMDALSRAVGRIAHELSTPISLTKGSAQHIEEQSRRLLSLVEKEMDQACSAAMAERCANIKEMMEVLLISTNRSMEIITNFKEIVAYDRAGQKTHFALLSYVRSVLGTLKSELDRRGIEVRVQGDDCTIYQHKGVFYQIVQNLMSNVQRYAYEGEGLVEIAVEDRGAAVLLRVIDYGKGIPPDRLPHIFEAFYTTGGGKGGMGLGLDILYRIITQQLKGSIRCESEEGKGTTFFIAFPKNTTADTAPKDQAKEG